MPQPSSSSWEFDGAMQDVVPQPLCLSHSLTGVVVFRLGVLDLA